MLVFQFSMRTSSADGSLAWMCPPNTGIFKLLSHRYFGIYHSTGQALSCSSPAFDCGTSLLDVSVSRSCFSFVWLPDSSHKLHLFVSEITLGFLGKEKGGEKKMHLNIFDPGCRFCFISSPLPHLLFLFSAPLAPYMHSNHHLGEPDKLGSRRQHLRADLKSFLETAGSST